MKKYETEVSTKKLATNSEADKRDVNRSVGVVSGIPETDLDSSCSTYTLKADGTQCPSGSSGTTVTYTCEFVSPYGARGSKNIAVTFVSVGKNSCCRRFRQM